MTILLGNGVGFFRDLVLFGVGRAPVSLAVADFNTDGKPDLATANISGPDVSVVVNTTP